EARQACARRCDAQLRVGNNARQVLPGLGEGSGENSARERRLSARGAPEGDLPTIASVRARCAIDKNRAAALSGPRRPPLRYAARTVERNLSTSSLRWLLSFESD